jgi:dTDP-4-amino-4,6-dideoxygalactose transaminase
MGDELRYVAEAAESGWIAGDGGFTRRCRELLEEIHGGAPVLLTTSCTHALELAALLLGVGPGDEVAMPSFTFVSTANAFALRGATPIFADIDPETLNLDPADLAARITGRTRAVVPVHYAGVGCDMAAIGELAEQHGLTVVEDNAHGLFGGYRDRPLGTFGALAALSFHETKNVTCGEGGALVLHDRSLLARAEVLREKGTDRSRFFRGEVDRYTWREIGSSYLPADLLAAFLLGQLEARERIQERRRRLWERYRDGLDGWCRATGARPPAVPPDRRPAWHLFHLLMPTPESRDRLIAHLRERGILAVFHYLPLHLSPVGRRFGGREGELPVTEGAAARLIRLPLFPGLTDAEQERVIDAVSGFVA